MRTTAAASHSDRFPSDLSVPENLPATVNPFETPSGALLQDDLIENSLADQENSRFYVCWFAPEYQF